MKINRVWAMPNQWTFTIKPIRQLIDRYIDPLGKDWVDPFAGKYSPAEIKNDLNPEFNDRNTHNMDALSFLKKHTHNRIYKGCLFDPPYSITQATECYKSFGKEFLEINVSNMKYWAECKNEIGKLLKKDGIVICCGWSSNGLGINRGFEMIEMLVVAHGGSKNDTIVTVERKTK